ncbi:MAG: DUF362 domain-containing protein [Deltaproteobacteria bacterium]|nr:DUF362 domain-containing protein [Deltaproteobacteria bacterium]
MKKKDVILRKLTRRDFLKFSAKTGFLLTIGYPFISSSCKSLESAGTSNVVDLAVATGDPGKAVLKAIDILGGMKRFVKEGQRVVIKPNMSFAKTPDHAANTNPHVVAAVAKACIIAGAKNVLVLDHTLEKPEECLKLSGIRKACKSIERTDVRALNDEKFYQAVSLPQGKAMKQVKIMKDVINSDVLINLPIAKSHFSTEVTLGMKGLMGLIWDRVYLHSAKGGLDQCIADLSLVLKPKLTIIDASSILVTNGPMGPGKVERMNTMIAGVDPVAVDTYGVGLARWSNKKVEVTSIKHIMAAHQMGLGNINLDQLRIKKESV